MQRQQRTATHLRSAWILSLATSGCSLVLDVPRIPKHDASGVDVDVATPREDVPHTNDSVTLPEDIVVQPEDTVSVDGPLPIDVIVSTDVSRPIDVTASMDVPASIDVPMTPDVSRPMDVAASIDVRPPQDVNTSDQGMCTLMPRTFVCPNNITGTTPCATVAAAYMQALSEASVQNCCSANDCAVTISDRFLCGCPIVVPESDAARCAMNLLALHNSRCMIACPNVVCLPMGTNCTNNICVRGPSMN